MFKRKIYMFLIFALALMGCNDLSFISYFDKGTLLAKAGRNELYFSDVEHIFYEGMSEKDSTELLKQYVENWGRKTIKLSKAEELMKDKSSELDALIKQYRERLLLNNYDNYLSCDIDTVVTSAQVASYYNSHKELFLLPSAIIKGYILSYPKSFRSENSLLKLLKSSKEQDKYDFLDLVKKNNLTFIEYTDWTYFSQALKNIPFNNMSIDDFFSDGKSRYEFNDETHNYIMVIESYRKSGDFTPVEMVRTNIEKIILNSRRSDYLKKVDDSIYNRARRKGELEINLDNI